MEKPSSLDALLHQPVRTLVAAYLAGRGRATFTELKRALSLTDGNLDAHLRKMIEAGYLATHRDDSVGRVQTVFSLTEGGRTALDVYFGQLARLREFAAHGSDPAPASDAGLDAGGATT